MADGGWWPDPHGRHEKRYYDGGKWTKHVADDGEQSVEDDAPDTSGAPPPPPPPDLAPDDDGVADSGGEVDASEKKKRAVVGGILAAIVVAFVAWAYITDDGDDSGTTDDREFAAFSICKQFVTDRLQSPATASFRNYFEDDGEVVVRVVSDDRYVVTSTVDSENGFGAMLRTGFVCTVTPADGDQWRLVSVEIDG